MSLVSGEESCRPAAGIRNKGIRERLGGVRFIRELNRWRKCPTVILPNVQQFAESLTKLRFPACDTVNDGRNDEAPIFILSTGQRSGSTLLQRILVTDPRLILWGEPLGEMTLVPNLTEMLYQLGRDPLGQIHYIEDDDLTSSRMATSWIALLFPPPDDFRLALADLFNRWLGVPARQRGFMRWGFKEVRLGAVEAYLLHWLYPQAKFLFLTRHPYDCYRSVADSGWTCYYRHPDVRLDSAAWYARNWNRLVLSWSELPPGFPSVHIKYEDLIQGKVDFRKLESWLNLEIKEELALTAKVGKTAMRKQLTWYERFIIKSEAAAGMKSLQYAA